MNQQHDSNVSCPPLCCKHKTTNADDDITITTSLHLTTNDDDESMNMPSTTTSQQQQQECPSPVAADLVQSLNSSASTTLSSFQSSIATISSSSTTSTSVKAVALHENLMRCHQRNRNPYDIYEWITTLGEGSMGSVCKVRKRPSAMGGSARPSFVRRQSTNTTTTRSGKEETHGRPGNKDNSKKGQHNNNNNANNGICGGGSDCFFLGKLLQFLPSRGGEADSSFCVVEENDEQQQEQELESSSSSFFWNHHQRCSSSMISYHQGRSSSRGKQQQQQYYALKSILLDRCSNKSLQNELQNEIAILRELDHPHVARAIETFEITGSQDNNNSNNNTTLCDNPPTHNRLFIVLELCSGGDLYSRDPYTEIRAAEILLSILSAVSYLHSKGIVHRDLKFENIMFVDKRPEAEVKLIDFGLSQKFALAGSSGANDGEGEEEEEEEQQMMEDAVGTVYTMAPELLLGQYNSKVDVWSVGVIAFMLLSSSMPFYGATRYQVMKKICKGQVRFASKRWQEVSKYGKGVVRHLLESDPTERPSADRALKYTKAWMETLIQEQQQQQQDKDIPPARSPPQQQSMFLKQIRSPQHSPSSTTSTSTTTTTTTTSSFSERPTTKKLQWHHPQHHHSTTSSSDDDDDDEIEMMDRIQASIQAFAQYTTLKKLALMVIAYKSRASEIGWLRCTFQHRFDLSQDGEISLEEFMEALSNAYDYTPEEMETLFLGMDVDGTGSVHYTEFLAATIEAHGSIEESRIADAFDRIDCDDSGFITIQNLREFLGVDVPLSYLESIIDDADVVQDRRISYEEFLQLWDSTCYDTLCRAQPDVAHRRMKHKESLMMSFSDGGTTCDEASEKEEGEANDIMPELDPMRDPEREYPTSDKVTATDVPLSAISKRPKPHITRTELGPVECFSQRKALSQRGRSL